MTQTNIPADVRERIIAAAAELYEQAGRENLPTVDAVRRAARADMNTTSAVMREWRRAQTAQAAPVAVTVPEVVTQANTAALAALWQQAQELANESLRAAQAAWETSLDEAQYTAGVQAIKDHILEGDVYQVNLCRVLSAPMASAPPGPDAVALPPRDRKDQAHPWMTMALACDVPPATGGPRTYRTANPTLKLAKCSQLRV